MYLQLTLPLMRGACAGSLLELKWQALRQSLGRWQKVIYPILGAILVLALFWVAHRFFVASPNEYMTEFYLLGKGRLAENYPRQAFPGEELTVTMGIMNRDGEAHHYRIEIWAHQPAQQKRELVNQTELGMIQPNITQEEPLVWSMPWVGLDQKAQFLLFIDDHEEPNRELELSINVIEPLN